MTTSAIPRSRLRRLAELRPSAGRVLSVFLDLDPAQFATGAARASQITSVLDAAGRKIDNMGDLDHDERKALRADVERVRGALDPASLGAGGVRGLAIYACGPADLLEIVRLPHPVQTAVFINHTPHIEPLAATGESERWCIVLVSRKDGRAFLGSEHELEEMDGSRTQDDVHGQHDQGGWSQARFQRSVEEEKRDHLDRFAEAIFDLFRVQHFDRLLVGGPEPLDHEFEARLHPYLRERLAGRVQVDVENINAAELLESAKPVFEDHQRARERAALERLRAGWNREGGRAVGGLQEVQAALEQQRVELLMMEPRASERVNGLEEAIERAVEQAAEILVVRHHADLGAHGGVAALLRW